VTIRFLITPFRRRSHGAEDLFVGDAHFHVDAGEHGDRLREATARHRLDLPAVGELGTLRLAVDNTASPGSAMRTSGICAGNSGSSSRRLTRTHGKDGAQVRELLAPARGVDSKAGE
jgi:hypothetical protein